SELGWMGLKRFKAELEAEKVQVVERMTVKNKAKAQMAAKQAKDLKAKYEEKRKNSAEAKRRERLSRFIKSNIKGFKSIVEIIHPPVDFLDALGGQLDNISLEDLETLH